MYFSAIKSKKRTDNEFRLRLDKDHHNHSDNIVELHRKGPLEEIPGVDMIDSFAIDSLHVLYLGVTKKILKMNFKKLRFPTSPLLRNKIEKTDHNKIFLTLSSAQMSKPSEFHRAIRSLDYISFYKGSELRNFLLYHGIVALKGHISKDIYENFLTLHCAVPICSTNKFRAYVNIAKHLFEKFVKDYKQIYGKCMASHNVHQLLHIAEYVLKFGPVENYSAFQYESKLGILGNLICSGHHPLEQAANRVVEHVQLDIDDYIQKQQANSSPEPIIETKSISFNDFTLKVNDRDKWFQTKSKDIVCLEKMKFNSEGNFENMIGRKIKMKTNYYESPLRSSILDIFESNGLLEEQQSVWSISDVEHKLFCIQDLNKKHIFFPILHTSSNFNDIEIANSA